MKFLERRMIKIIVLHYW